MGLQSRCKCVDDPYTCLDSQEFVTQLNEQTGSFKNSPQPHREDELSVFRGQRTLEEALSLRIRSIKPPFDPEILEGRELRTALVGDLRDAGFGVVHTPGKSRDQFNHCSLVLPPMPDDEVLASWPTSPRDFPALLDSIFKLEVTQEVKR